MRNSNVPLSCPRYWAALMLASIFGANLGDFISRVLHLGHAVGLPPLALVFAFTLLAERRLELGSSQAYYWTAIVTVRAAATNLADLSTHDLKLTYPVVLSGLALLLISVLAVEARSRVRRGYSEVVAPFGGMPATNGFYWAAMLIAGTLGTAAGDFAAGDLGLGNSSIVLCAIVVTMLWLRSRSALPPKASYWLAVVAIRAAGTTVGDGLARLSGLTVSTVCTGLLLILTVLLWRERRETPLTGEAPSGAD